MAQYDYTALTVANATSGNAILASDHEKVFQNVNDLIKPPMCVLRRTSLFTMTSANTDYTITFTSGNEDADNGGMHNGSTDTDRITITEAGIYAITASCQFGAPNFVGSNRQLWLDMRGSVNGTLVADIQIPVSGEASQHSISTIVECEVNDYFRMFVRHNDNLSRDVVVTTSPILFSAAWLGQKS